jgi:YidC/Oxa1 family membrane protein insertase
MDKENFNAKTMVAIVICVVIFIFWQKHTAKKQQAYVKYQKEQQLKNIPQMDPVETKSIEGSKTNNSALKQQGLSKTDVQKNIVPTQAEEKEFVYRNKLMTLVFSSKGAAIKQSILNDYKKKNNNIIVQNDVDPRNFSFVINYGDTSQIRDYELVRQTDKEMVFKSGITKTFTFFKDSYHFQVQSISNSDKTPYIKITSRDIKSKSSFLKPAALSNIRSIVFLGKDGVDSEDFKSIPELEVEEKKDKIVKWNSLGNKYFMTSVILTEGRSGRLTFDKANENIYSRLEVAKDSKLTFIGYVGPKELNKLKEVTKFVGGKSSVVFEKNIDYGWLSVLAVPILQGLKFIFKYVPNWGVSIIILTILIKLLMYPLTSKSFKAMKDLQKVQPELQKLKEKYKDDKETLNRETMQLMKRNKVNPMGSCFPILLQMPVFFAMYRVFGGSVELYQAPFMLWITDLSQMDKFFVLPIAMGLFMFLQQKLTPTTADPAQAKVMMFMPVLFTFIMLTLPSGLNLYFLVNTAFSVFQQMYIHKSFNKKNGNVVTKSKTVTA